MRKKRNAGGFLTVSAVVALAGGAAWVGQWRETVALRTVVEQTRVEANELARLRTENARLRSAQVSAEELERLRADHAALPRLRAEIDALRKRIDGGAR